MSITNSGNRKRKPVHPGEMLREDFMPDYKRLARFFRNSPEFWLNAQQAVDLWEAERTYNKELSRILPLAA